jgi:hypothetical protein
MTFPATPVDVPIIEHSIVMAIPFQWRESVSGESPLWTAWRSALDKKTEAEFQTDRLFFLPVLRRMLFPEWEEGKAGDGCAHFALRKEALIAQSWTLTAQRAGFRCQIHLEGAEALIFPGQIGFLNLRFHLKTYEAGVLRDVLRLLRILEATSDWSVTWTPDEGVPFATGRLVDFLLQGLSRPCVTEDFALFLTTAPSEVRPKDDFFEVYAQVARFFVLAIVPQEVESLDRLLVEVGNLADFSDPDLRPHASVVEQQLRENRVAVWDNWQALVLRDNVVYAAYDSSFTRNVLRRNFLHCYFPLHLFSLYLRLRLSQMSQRLVASDSHQASHQEVRAIWQEFLEFRHRLLQPTVTLRPQGNALFRCANAAQGVSELANEILGILRDLKEFYELEVEAEHEERSRRIESGLTYLGLAIAVPSLVGQFLSVELPVDYARVRSPYFFVTVLASAAVGLGLAWVVSLLRTRAKR